MANIINQDSVNRDRNQNPFMGMSREQLLTFKDSNPQMFQQKQDLSQRVSSGLGQVGDIFLQSGGVTPPQRDRGGLNDFMQKELLKQQIGRPAAEIKEQEVLAKTGREEEKLSLARSKEEREQLKFEREEVVRVDKAEKSSQLVQDSTDELLDSIKEVKAGSKFFGLTGVIPAIPDIQAGKVKWQANLDKLLSKRILALMTEMKQASRTGATGFGQLSEKELKVLQDGSTALKKFMSEKDALEILNKMEAKLLKIKVGGGTTNDTLTEQPTVGLPTNSSDGEFERFQQAIGE